MTTMMRAWQLDRLGGALTLGDVPVPEVRPGSVLVRVEAQSLMSYFRRYVEGALPAYRAPTNFIPGGNAVGMVDSVGDDVWHLKPGQSVILSSHLVARENVPDPGQILIGVTSPGGTGDDLQRSWKNGTLAEYALFPAQAVTPLDRLAGCDAAELATLTRFVVPYGGLVRGRLAAGETMIVNGATGAYGAAAVLLALAMGAARVVALGRNPSALAAIAEAGGPNVSPVRLTGDVEQDSSQIREASGGGAEMALDMIGGATDANATLATLGAMRRGGRVVLMGSASAPLPLDYNKLMFNNLELVGNFMHRPDAYQPLAALVDCGRLRLDLIGKKVFDLADLRSAMPAAEAAGSLEMIVVRSWRKLMP